MTQRNKCPFIFVVGFNKTATTAIHHFFEDNGFPSIHWDQGRLAKAMVLNCLENRKILSGYDKKYRVYSDMIVRTRRILIEANALFPAMNRDYPGSYFIYNTRNIDEWLESRAAHTNEVNGESMLQFEFRRLRTRERSIVFDHWKSRRLEFEAELRAYFEGSNRLLEIDIANPDFSKEISNFLGIELDGRHWAKYNVRRVDQRLSPRPV
jgi:hypothetical protein